MNDVASLSRLGSVGIITIDNPPINALGHAVRAGLQECMTIANADPALKVLIIFCAGRTFFAGADIREFGKPARDPDLSTVIDGIENSAKPVIAAIHGTALGGGLEVALGCHFRLAVGTAKMGLPEVKLGIIPGAGGTQRLPRLVGPETAVKLIVDGVIISATKAKELGLIDHVVDGDLRSSAVEFAGEVALGKHPVRQVGALPVTAPAPGFFVELEQSVAKKQRGFAAPLRCIQAVKAACELPFAAGRQIERKLFVELVTSPQSAALRHVFFAEREVAKLSAKAAGETPRPIQTVGVVGAGTMGRGIACCFANSGIPVTLLETSQEALDRGMAGISAYYAGALSKGNISESERAKRLELVSPTLSYAALGAADLVVEAVFEDMAVKQQVFRQLDAVCKPGAILASNTSYLNVDEIARVTRRPAEVMGMHFFSPAVVMKLVEVARGAATAPDVLATAMKLGKDLGKVPVPVGICRGYIGNRMLWVRTREHGFMLEEGALPQQIDQVLYDFGFPMGPFAVWDLAGLDISWRSRQSLLAELSERERANTLLDKIYRMGRLGQKTGAGYYNYDDQRRATPDPLIDDLIIRHSKERGMVRRQFSVQEILERSLYSMINEGAKILEEGIAVRSSDIDLVWIYGYGYPRYRGGPMYYADQVGLKEIHASILRYRQQFGAEFWEPAPLLTRLAEAGQAFSSLSNS